jgi:hypothetical protein
MIGSLPVGRQLLARKTKFHALVEQSGEAVNQPVPPTASGTEECRTRKVEGRRVIATKRRKNTRRLESLIFISQIRRLVTLLVVFRVFVAISSDSYTLLLVDVTAPEY